MFTPKELTVNAHNLGQQTENMSLEQFEAESFDERHEAEFDGKLDNWWTTFWRSFAAAVAIGARKR